MFVFDKGTAATVAGLLMDSVGEEVSKMLQNIDGVWFLI